ncbi:Wzz/FepE/Etk N-terminal domain-containing protein [uncultured Maricaulis sp.]|uniref:GumC family protein n=1 Tax=uncultured Maricaulis sp. TaxID=174710 RepID=UPI0030DA437D|tara:strand:+ start:80084 stop:81607 length:1524 start_codon:yes stop_codon:yes gene_type:complete
MTRDHHTSGPNEAPATGLGSGTRGDLDLFDVIALAWSEKGFIALVFAVLFALGVAASLTMLKPTYQAHSTLMILQGDNPTPATAGSGDAFILAQVMQSESQLLSSATVLRRTLDALGPEQILGEVVLGDADTAALKTLSNSFSLAREPNSSAIDASYSASSATRSALVLNAIIDAYLAYREEVLIETGVAGLTVRRNQANESVQAAQAARDDFLLQHDLSNFEVEQQTTDTLVGDLTDRVNTSSANLESARAGAAAIRDRLRSVPENIELYVENGIDGVLLDRQSERARLLSRYQAGAPAVVAIDREIAAIETFLASGTADGRGQSRTGPNPVRQSLETDLATREANAQAESSLLATLQQQLRVNRDAAARLRQLEPEFTRLEQNVVAAEQAAAIVAGQEATASARRSSTLGGADAVRLIDRATPPLQAKSMKKLGLIAAFVMAGGIALFSGLMRGYWRVYIGVRAMPAPARQMQPIDGAATAQAGPAANDLPPDIPILARVFERTA